MAGEAITITCRNGHESTYPGPAGRSVKCRKCRVSVWLKKPPVSSQAAGDASVWADETPWEGQATAAGPEAVEACSACGSVQHWTPGRTSLRCSGCDTVTLPLAVRESAAQARPGASVSTAIALTPEQEIDALIAWEARQNNTVTVLRNAAQRLADPAAYLEDSQDRKNAANTASALRTLARLASEAENTERLDLIEAKAVNLATQANWLVARFAAEQEAYEDDEDDYEDDYEEQPRALPPSSAIPATVLPGTYVPAASIPNPNPPRYGASESNAYARLAEERARKRRENEAARQAAGECAGKHRTLGLFPYHPKVQYRLWKVEQQYSPYSWDGSGVPTFAGGYVTSPNRTHVMDGCYSCMQKAAGDEPGMEYETLWTGMNTQMSMIPIGLLLVAGLALVIYMKSQSSGYRYESWGYDRW